MGLLRGIKRIAKNLIYLCTHDLSNGDLQRDMIYHSVRQTEELVRTRMVFTQDDSFQILSEEESWKQLLSNPKSFLRIGDGELMLIQGKPIEFQDVDPRLSEYLIRILSGDRTDLYIGIDHNYFNGFENINETMRQHNYLYGPKFKETLVKYCNPHRTYLASGFNQLYTDFNEYDWEKYQSDIRALFEGKDIVVFAGKGIFDKLKHNLFDLAHSCEYVWSRPKNAFSEFDSLLEKARAISKDKVLCFVLGPTAKPLVYELSREGYTAWDIGHMAKDYDCCLKKSPKGKKEIYRFFAPD